MLTSIRWGTLLKNDEEMRRGLEAILLDAEEHTGTLDRIREQVKRVYTPDERHISRPMDEILGDLFDELIWLRENSEEKL